MSLDVLLQAQKTTDKSTWKNLKNDKLYFCYS